MNNEVLSTSRNINDDEEKINNLFCFLNNHSVRYVVLRGNRTETEIFNSKDIDIYVDREHMKFLTDTFKKFGLKLNKNQWGKHPHVFYELILSKGRLSIIFDVIDSFFFGYEMYRLDVDSKIFDYTMVRSNIKIFDEGIEVFLLLCHIAFDKKSVSKNNFERYLYLINKLEIMNIESRFLSLTICFNMKIKVLVESFISYKTIKDLEDSLVRFKNELINYKIVKKNELTSQIDRIRNGIKSRTHKPLKVALVGLDGSGKSSLINLIKEKNDHLLGSCYMGYVEGKTKILQKIFNYQNRKNNIKFINNILTLISLIVIPIDMNLRIYKAKKWRNIVIMDRHPCLEMHEGNTILKIRSYLTNKIVSKPDIIILCDGNSEIIWNRKKEVSYSDHKKRQSKLIEKYEKSNIEKYCIDTAELNLEESYNLFITYLSKSQKRIQHLYYKEKNV